MTNLSIVIACSNGRNRSIVLRDHLKEKGYDAHAIAAADRSSHAKRCVRNADVVITVHELVETELLENYETLENKKHIKLNVPEWPGTVEKSGKKLNGDEWLEYQRETVHPTLLKQIKKHLPIKVKKK
jgi:galactitol-specific phosphotransferase system IIB component